MSPVAAAPLPTQYDVRLVAYPVFTGTRGKVLRGAETFTFTLARYGWAVCTVDYREGAAGAELLEGGGV